MALSKRIELDNGVAVNYHRVVSVNIITNQCNVIEVASYTSRSKREEEAAAIENSADMNVFIDTRFYNAEYDQGMTVESAYGWLKSNVEEFADADDLDEGAAASDADVISDGDFVSMIEEVM